MLESLTTTVHQLPEFLVAILFSGQIVTHTIHTWQLEAFLLFGGGYQIVVGENIQQVSYNMGTML